MAPFENFFTKTDDTSVADATAAATEDVKKQKERIAAQSKAAEDYFNSYWNDLVAQSVVGDIPVSDLQRAVRCLVLKAALDNKAVDKAAQSGKAK